MMLRLGYHVSVAGSLALAFGRASELGCTAMQIFVSNPRGWEVRPVPKEEIESFTFRSKTSGISPVVAHMPYLPNLASANKSTRAKTLETLNKTASLCSQLGVGYLVTHLGSHLGLGSREGTRNVIETINEATVPPKVGILLENTSGQTNSVGSTLEELALILDGVHSGVELCLDTCHLFAAGYDITKAETIASIDETLGMGRVAIFHLNDAKFELGSRKDRHENIGKGYIGKDGFREFLSFSEVRKKPMILETPEASAEELSLVRTLAGK